MQQPLSQTPFTIALRAQNTTQPADGLQDTLTATVNLFGYPYEGATLMFGESQAYPKLYPTEAITNSNGVATAYISSTTPGNVMVSANFAGYQANAVVDFESPFLTISFVALNAINSPNTILTVNGIQYTNLQLPVSISVTAGSRYAYVFANSITVNGITEYRPTVTGCGTTSSTGVITASYNCTITVNYLQSSALCYTVQYIANPSSGGTVTPLTTNSAGCPLDEYNSGTAVTVTESPSSGYTFTDWTGASGGFANSISIYVTGATSETGWFTQASGYIYCVGSDESPYDYTYYAPVSSSGVGAWTAGPTYPDTEQNSGCAIYNGDIYCVGSDTSPSNQVYYDTISSSGFGSSWSSTNSYPLPVQYAGCSTYNGDIYCVGSDSGSENQIYYAPISSSGVGTWTSTTPYPLPINDGYSQFGGTCDIYNGYIYCVGTDEYNSVAYYAPVSSSGVGSWTQTTSYPVVFDNNGCTMYKGYIYCTGSQDSSASFQDTYYAPVSSTGIGTWEPTTQYPLYISDEGCAIYNGYIYCVGSSGPAVYYASVSPSGIGPWTETTSLPVTQQNAYCEIPGGSGGYFSGGGISGFVPLYLYPLSLSAGIIYQGQTATITGKGASGATPPYSYQWFAEGPGGSGLTAGEANTLLGTGTSNGEAQSQNAFFTGTAVGNYLFQLQVTDSELTQVVTSNIFAVNVISTASAEYVPINIINSQSTATQSAFQEMLTVNSLTYKAYINSGWSNVEFTSGAPAASGGTVLQAWVESNPSNTATNTVVWVSLTISIAADSNTLIYMNFMPINVLSASGPTGEAPQLSCANPSNTFTGCGSNQYGEYDNGAQVFFIYDNFAGDQISYEWNTAGMAESSTTYAVDNSIDVYVSAFPTAVFSQQNEYTGNVFVDSLEDCQSCDAGFGVAFSSEETCSGCGITNGQASSGAILFTGTGFGSSTFEGPMPTDLASATANSLSGVFYVSSNILPINLQNNVNYVMSLGVTTNAISEAVNYMYANTLYSSFSNTDYPGMIVLGTGGTIYYQWFRVRAYPPNDVMPTAVYGSVG